MKAMYIKAPGQVEFKDIEMPVRKKGEVLLKILYGGVIWALIREPLLTLIIRVYRDMNSPRK